MESYIEHIQSLFEEKVTRVQFDNRALRRELEQRGGPNEGQLAHIRRLLKQQSNFSTSNGDLTSSGVTGSSSSGGTNEGQLQDDNPDATDIGSGTTGNEMTLVEQVDHLKVDFIL